MKKYIIIGAAVIVLIIILVLGFSGPSRSIPTIRAKRGGFIISLSENGRLDAQRSVTISAPRIRGGLQIVKLAKEGSIVKKGDFLVQFDPTDKETTLRDAEAELKITEANLERVKAQYEMDLKQFELELKKAERNYSENLSEAPVIRKEAELTLELARLTYKQKKIILEADINKQQVEVDKARDKRNQAARDLRKMTITAPIPGLVVYMEIWKGGTMEKVQEGDSPWGGQGLINLPDLSTMIVETTVSEVDVSKVEIGQKAKLTLDAIPGPVFNGTVSEISTLARRKEAGSQINVFDLDILIDSADARLKPGMSARVDIIIDEYDDVLSVPLEAVFERDDTTVVYTKSGKKIPVALGARNDYSVIIISGLEEGDELRLVDPTRKTEDLTPAAGDETQKTQPRKRHGGRKTVIIGG